MDSKHTPVAVVDGSQFMTERKCPTCDRVTRHQELDCDRYPVCMKCGQYNRSGAVHEE